MQKITTKSNPGHRVILPRDFAEFAVPAIGWSAFHSRRLYANEKGIEAMSHDSIYAKTTHPLSPRTPF